MKVIVDYDVCASTGTCMQVCPEVFEVRSDGYLYVLQEEPPRGAARQGPRGRRPLPDGRHHRSRSEWASTPSWSKAWSASGSMLCVGLDPDPARFPAPLDGAPDAIDPLLHGRSSTPPPTWCARSSRRSPTSPRSAPSRSWSGCARTSASEYPDVVLILDAKRGDIGSTAEHYAREAFGRYGADAVTVNPYLGTDAVEPVPRARRRRARPVPHEQPRQRRPAGPRRRRATAVRARRRRWSPSGGRRIGDCGLVVGATYPERAGRRADDRRRPADPRAGRRRPGRRPRGLRRRRRDATDGTGLIVSSSRAILYASPATTSPTAARAVALRTREPCRAAR